MAGGGGHGEWSTHIRMYVFKWLCSAPGIDFDDPSMRDRRAVG